MTLIPAYGRDYKSRAAVLADLKAGKDFIYVRYVGGNKPINLGQILAEPFGTSINVRYSNLRKVAVFKREKLE